MTDYRIERVSALDRAYDAIELELDNNSDNTGKSLEKLNQLSGILNQKQKKTENDIAREAEEQARKTNQKHVATYRGTDYQWLPSDYQCLSGAEVGAYAITALATGFGSEQSSKGWNYVAQGISSGKGWRHNSLEAQRTEHGSDKSSLDTQSQSMRGSANQHGQSTEANIQQADRIARETHELVMRTITV